MVYGGGGGGGGQCDRRSQVVPSNTAPPPHPATTGRYMARLAHQLTPLLQAQAPVKRTISYLERDKKKEREIDT